MKKVSSPVWRFFERILEDNRCIAVMCKLCEHQYKFFGNTTNLRVHLTNKHPIQWELSESGNFDDSTVQNFQNAAQLKTEPRSTRKQKYGTRNSDQNVCYSVSVDKNEDSATGTTPKIEIQRVEPVKVNSDSDQDDDATTINMVRQMHGDENSAEEWLEEDPFQITHIETFEPKPKRRRIKYRKIKREIQDPTDLPGFYVAPKPPKVVYEDPQIRKDEYSVFGEYVANKLRKFKNPRTRGNLQQLVTTLLWQAEYGMYDSAEAVKRVLMVSVTPDPETPEVSAANITKEYVVAPVTETVLDISELNQGSEDLGQ